MKTQKPLLILYTVFIIGSLVYLAFVQHTVDRSRFAPGAFDRLRDAAEATTNIEHARRNIIKYIDLIESSEQMTSEFAQMNNYYIAFAIVFTLPLAAYAGQSLRNKLFITRPANMPKYVYWTLWGVNTRGTAVRYMWLSVALALVACGASFVNPVSFIGILALVTAEAYRRAIKWVDDNSFWANKTTPPW